MSDEREIKRVAPLSSLDDEARAELLCYVVVGQLVAQTRTGKWLAINHLIELIEIWLRSNGVREDWIDEFEFAFTDSPAIAQAFLSLPDFVGPDKLARLFADGMRLDYRSSVVMAIYSVCDAILRKV